MPSINPETTNALPGTPAQDSTQTPAAAPPQPEKPVSARQLAVNRANAKLASTTVLPFEPLDSFRTLSEQYHVKLKPQDDFESTCVENRINAQWGLCRARSIETCKLLAHHASQQGDNDFQRLVAGSDQYIDSKRLDAIGRHQSRLERSEMRAYKLLVHAREHMRDLEPAEPPPYDPSLTDNAGFLPPGYGLPPDPDAHPDTQRYSKLQPESPIPTNDGSVDSSLKANSKNCQIEPNNEPTRPSPAPEIRSRPKLRNPQGPATPPSNRLNLMPPIDRREVLAGFAGLVLSGISSSAAPGRNLKVQSPRPEDYEMELAGFESYLTPNESFFVRTHTYTPTVDTANYEIKIHGLVDKPVTIKLADLQKMKKTELVVVLECAGNGRANYRPTVPGLQWDQGSVGNAKWTGVRLKDVLALAGAKTGATDLAFNGADQPAGTQPKFIRSVPMEKCMHPDTLLAWEMNGQPLPQVHGGPVRLVVPGWAGDSWVKWVQDIELIDHEFDGFFMKTAYRHPVKPVAPGAAVDPKDMVPVTWVNIKSVIHSPKTLAAGKVVAAGVAWGGQHPVAKVEVSVNDGKTWKLAKLDNKKTQYGWRMWSLPLTVPADGVLVARATDAAGNVQPTEQQWNPSGYLWNVQERVAMGPRPEPVVVKGVEFPGNVKAKCLVCHDDHMMQGQRLTRAQWDREVDKMTRWGAAVKPEDKPAIVDFLASKYPAK